MALLSPKEIAVRLATLPQWGMEAGILVRIFQWDDFRASVSFVNHVADLAEAANHHPDIEIRYNRVRISLTTHDANGLTAKDFDLAAQIDALL
jgi:4a-hydroxytetrahydrobiopterin dehydratase